MGDTTESLFFDNGRLINAEDWLLRLDYSVSKPSKVQEQQKTRLEMVKDVLIKILPDVSEIRFDASSGVRPTPKVEFKTPYGWVPLKQLGYGYRTMIAWVVDFAARMVERYPDSTDPLAEPAVVLVDEIDLHLHPKWQREVIGFLTERFPNTQFIVTSHSPLIVQAAPDANIALLRREGDHVVIENHPETIRGWRVDQILTSDLFGLETARPPDMEKDLLRQKELLTKSRLTKADQKELEEIDKRIGPLPTGESFEQARDDGPDQGIDRIPEEESGPEAVIRIKKPKQAPAILRTRGGQATTQLCENYDSSSGDYKNGTRSFTSRDFDSTLYGAQSVKNALRKAQHDKCAFCESKVTHIAYGDVEHFRPKAGYRQRPDGPLVRPGYYWLAYEWSNLFFCCALCNQKFKRNHFPLADPARRAVCHHDNIEMEQSLLIHPELDDPASFLEFDQEYVRAIDGHPRGEATIRILGLNRSEIVEKRRDALDSIKALIDCRELIARQAEENPSPESSRRLAVIDERLDWFVKKYRSDSAEYAAMIRAVLRVAIDGRSLSL